MSECVYFCPIFLPLFFVNPFLRRFVLAEWLNPFSRFFFSVFFRQDAGQDFDRMLVAGTR